MIRFADDAVMGFEFQEDAEKVFRVLPKRFGQRIRRIGLVQREQERDHRAGGRALLGEAAGLRKQRAECERAVA
jgi:hypothetical protein